jgi:hypothetical protein
MITSVSTSVPNTGMNNFNNSDFSNYLTAKVNIPVSRNRTQPVQLTALIDSGSFADCADLETMIREGVPIIKKPIPIEAEVIDGRSLDPITHETAPLPIFVNGHHDTVVLDVIDSPHYPIILGLPWLKKNNPEVDWNRLSMKFPRKPHGPSNILLAINEMTEKLQQPSLESHISLVNFPETLQSDPLPQQPTTSDHSSSEANPDFSCESPTKPMFALLFATNL